MSGEKRRLARRDDDGYVLRGPVSLDVRALTEAIDAAENALVAANRMDRITSIDTYDLAVEIATRYARLAAPSAPSSGEKYHPCPGEGCIVCEVEGNVAVSREVEPESFNLWDLDSANMFGTYSSLTDLVRAALRIGQANPEMKPDELAANSDPTGDD